MVAAAVVEAAAVALASEAAISAAEESEDIIRELFKSFGASVRTIDDVLASNSGERRNIDDNGDTNAAAADDDDGDDDEDDEDGSCRCCCWVPAVGPVVEVPKMVPAVVKIARGAS